MAVGFHHVSGPTIGELRRRVEAARSAAFRARLAQNLAEEARHQVDDGFAKQRDPYGKPWQPLRYRKGNILQKTGRMKASTATQPGPDGFLLEITAEYAVYHQKGARLRRRVNLHSRSGRFMSRLKADKSRFRSQRVSFSREGAIPQRMMVPTAEAGGLGPIWRSAFDKITAKVLDDTFRGRT